MIRKLIDNKLRCVKGMSKDEHMATGEYDSEKYWNVRAKYSNGSCLSAVCVFGATEKENESDHRVQKVSIRNCLKKIDLKGKDVLECGCGLGRWIPLFGKCGSFWHGVDISEEMLYEKQNLKPGFVNETILHFFKIKD